MATSNGPHLILISSTINENRPITIAKWIRDEGLRAGNEDSIKLLVLAVSLFDGILVFHCLWDGPTLGIVLEWWACRCFFGCTNRFMHI